MEDERKCRVCNRRPALTKEHIPPQSVENRGRVDIRFIKEPTNGIKHESVELDNGFWMRVLCQPCNNRLGRLYGTQYREFYAQFADATPLVDTKGRSQIYLRNIYPARILKQIFAQYLCIHPAAPPPEWENIRNFVCRKDALLPADAPAVYLYRNASLNSRIVPTCGIMEFFTKRQPILVAEISWSPVGIIFCHRPAERFAAMENITGWGKLQYKQKINVGLNVPSLEITMDHPIAFGSPEEVERWRTERGIGWAIAETEYPDLETGTSLMLRRVRAKF